MMFDVIIEQGQITDGSGGPPYQGDVAIAGDRIAAIGDLSKAEARSRFSAAGYYVCPGFVDTHSHSDAFLLIEPSSPSKVYQGVTTEVIGNCGASAAPRLDRYQMPADWRNLQYPGRWQTVAEYRALLEQVRPAVNVKLLVGHNALRASIAGYDQRPLSPEERSAMIRLLEQSLDEGASGLSFGLIYPPGCFADREELLELARVVAGRNGICSAHMRNEGARVVEAVEEVLDIARAAEVRFQISHLKTSGRANWGLLDAVLDRVRTARKSGIAVCADRYPYTAACTDLDILLPTWALAGGREAILTRLRTPEIRRSLWQALAERSADSWAEVWVGSTAHPENRRFQGMPIPDVARELGVDPAEAVLRLLETDELHTSGIFFGMSEENMWRILAEPYVMIGSDASLRSTTGPLSLDHPHPRAYGAFARFLRASLDGRTVSWPEAVRKITSLPAQQFGLKDRGKLCVGAYADIVVVNPNSLADRATYSQPHQLAQGIELVLVNGRCVLVHGRLTGERPGLVLA